MANFKNRNWIPNCFANLTGAAEDSRFRFCQNDAAHSGIFSELYVNHPTLRALAVLFGTDTVSAGAILIAQLERRVEPILIGEPSGSAPNMFLNAKKFVLPHSKIKFEVSTGAPNDAPKKLVIRGVYRVTRNPVFVGVVTVIAGWGLLFQAGSLVLYVALVATGFHLVVVLNEERLLHRAFGDEYVSYCANVGRWLPRRSRRLAA